eukprot:m.337697 g.337697  ORF g.337697 m.337697 type:complete len:655 (+) comp18212_c0_seq1:413-2377(+)
MEDLILVMGYPSPTGGTSTPIRCPSPQEEEELGGSAQVRLYSAEAHLLFERKIESLLQSMTDTDYDDALSPGVLSDTANESEVTKTIQKPDKDGSFSNVLAQFGKLVVRAKNEVVDMVSSPFPCASPKRPKNEENRPRDFEVSFEDIEELKFLGSGSAGCVFLGVLNKEKVAIKKFKNPSHLSNEAGKLKSLDHPNVVRLLGVCTQPPVYCIIMELCHRSIFDELRETKIAPETVCNWARQVANGMEYIHERSLVHRDLKSGNILLALNRRTLKISDFGTTRTYGAKSTQMSFCGSVAWMAPEMVRSAPCSQMVDVWSFGVVLWELLTGQIPYKGVDTAAVIYGVGTGGLHLPVPSTTPLGFSLLLKQCFNTNPKHRPRFRQILLHLQIVEDDSGFLETPVDTYFETQKTWKHEVKGEFAKMKLDTHPEESRTEENLLKRREQELKHAEDVRRLYEERLNNASALLADIKAKARELEQLKSKPRKKRSKSFLVNKPASGRSGRKSRRNSGVGLASDGPPNSKAAKLRRSLERALVQVQNDSFTLSATGSDHVSPPSPNEVPHVLSVGSQGVRDIIRLERMLHGEPKAPVKELLKKSNASPNRKQVQPNVDLVDEVEFVVEEEGFEDNVSGSIENDAEWDEYDEDGLQVVDLYCV